MRLVVDANILFAALLKDSKTRQLILSNSLELYAPEFVLSEFYKHAIELSNKLHIKKEELQEMLRDFLILSKIKVIPATELKNTNKKAKIISPDFDDVQYFSIAIEYDCSIWSNDKALKKQKDVKIISTEELVRILD